MVKFDLLPESRIKQLAFECHQELVSFSSKAETSALSKAECVVKKEEILAKYFKMVEGEASFITLRLCKDTIKELTQQMTSS